MLLESDIFGVHRLRGVYGGGNGHAFGESTKSAGGPSVLQPDGEDYEIKLNFFKDADLNGYVRIRVTGQ